MLDGQIQSLSTDKGFGFIQPAAGGPDLFFHCSSVDAEFDSLTIGQQVQYEPDESAPKPRAKSVIFLCQIGGPSQIDLFEDKPELTRRAGEPLPESLLEQVTFAQIQEFGVPHDLDDGDSTLRVGMPDGAFDDQLRKGLPDDDGSGLAPGPLREHRLLDLR